MYTDHPIYVAACVFASKYPELNVRIQAYLRERFSIPTIRCCVPQYELERLANTIPEAYRPDWCKLPDFVDFTPDNTMLYICHNCRNIFLEQHPEVPVKSLWEFVLEDEAFPLPDLRGERIALQDCWRSNDNRAEQDAVRALLRKMNAAVVELPEHHEDTEFCGYSLYQPQPARNPKLAPKRYVEQAVGKFQPHTDEEKRAIMEAYCKAIPTDRVVAYCHYCVDGLKMGGTDALHLAELLFGMGLGCESGIDVSAFAD